MDSLARFSISHARFTVLLVVAALLGGLVTFSTQPRQEDPEITLRTAQVVTTVPGLPPDRVEKLLTQPIEEAIKRIAEVDEITSISMTGTSIVTPEVAPEFDDMAPIWSKLRNEMDDLRPQLPEGSAGPFVNDDYGRVAVVTIALTGEDYEMDELREVARDLRDDLGALPLVARVDLFGVQEERVWLEFDAATLVQFGVNPTDAMTSLINQNVVLPGGTINAAGENVVVEPSGDFRSLEDIQDVVFATSEGQLLYLRDIAEIHRGFVDPPEAPAFFNGAPAIILGVSMTGASNVVELGEQLQSRLAELRPFLPVGMNLDLAIFQPDLVEAAVNDATNNLLQTMVVVLVVVMLFLGWRTGLIVGAMVPLTMMVTLVVMSAGEIPLHRISIAAIIVALGLLVDNGVVIAEDIRRRMDDGANRLDAALATPRTLAIPLLTSSLTTVLAFLPLMLISDSTGEFLRSLGQVLAIALLASWVLAIALTPALCFWFLPDSGSTGPTDEEMTPESGAYRSYRRVLDLLLRHRVAFVAFLVLLLIAATQIFAFVKQRSLGPSARNQFVVYLDLPAQTHITETIATTNELSAFLRDRDRNPEVTDVLAYVGAGGPRFFLALAPNDPQPNKAFVVVNTKQPEDVGDLIRRTDQFILRELPEASGRAEILFLGPAALGTVELRIRGPRVETLRRLAAHITDIFHEVPGTQAIRNDWENAVLKMQVEVDQERARRAGVSSEAVARALSASFDGTTLTHYREGYKSIPVVIRARAEERDSLDRLRSVEILSASGEPIPLLQVADFHGDVEQSRIRRFNQQRAIIVAGKHPDMTAVELYAAMEPSLAELEVPRGYEIEIEGEIKGAEESNSKLFAFMPHALMGIVLLLVLQFDSFRRPLIILLTIPLVLIGANFGLAAFGAYFDFTAMLGLFSLAGIIINNGIVLIDRVDQGRSEGLAVDAAVVEAAVARARPIIMTTITTVVGLLPLALFGGEFWFGMAIVIICGLAVGTILTLGFVPVLYSLLFRRRDSAPTAA